MSNDQIILAHILKDRTAEGESSLSPSEYFEIFSAEQVLKNYELSFDDIQYGIVGDGGDGGIDSIFTFVNGELIREDTQINTNQKKNHIELIVIQSKTSPNFKEDAITKFINSADELLDLSHDLNIYTKRYNSDILERVRIFRETYKKTAGTIPILAIKYYYVTQGLDTHPNVSQRVEKLRETILRKFSGSDFLFEFVGASRLLAMTRDIPTSSRVLEISESPITTSDGSYVCLVNLTKYYTFITEKGGLAKNIFESNVRDYQGDVVVNTGIRTTLQNMKSENFWYLNNGVSILTPRAVLAGKQLMIEDPQIVNGLQTSLEIFRHFSQNENSKEDLRTILVRVICEQDENARDRIIRATNSQTAIPPASLRSSDDIHRNIEAYLKANGLFYDRKKNFYKNQGKPITKIVSIPYLAQCLMATILLQPNSARARPSTLINKDSEYKKLFDPKTPIDIYLKVIEIVKAVEQYLKPDNCEIEIDRKSITNIKFYIAMVVALKMTDYASDIVKSLSKIPSLQIKRDTLKEATEVVLNQYRKMGASDQVAKNSTLAQTLIKKPRSRPI